MKFYGKRIVTIVSTVIAAATFVRTAIEEGNVFMD
jgi:hypothetical protein